MTRLAKVLCLIALAVGPGARAADYSAYSYKDFDVLAKGSGSEALAIERRLSALDAAMRNLLHLPPGATEPPTRIYVLPRSDLAKLDPVWSSESGAFFRTGPFDDYVVLENETANAASNVHAERGRALLTSWGLARSPEWFRHGVSLFMAGARVEHDQLIIGQDQTERTERLVHNWIPMAQFLQLPANDPAFHRTPDTEANYEAQCWWLVHLTLLDGVLDQVMPAYLQRLLLGESQQVAYASTFGRPYEDLDQYFRKLRGKVKLKQYAVALPDAGTPAGPQQLTDVQVQARLAELLLAHEPQSAAGAQMAGDALTADPKNERAQLAFARHELAARRFVPVQESLQRLTTLEDLSAAGHRELAVLQSNLAKARDENMPGSSAVDSKTMRAAAREHFRRAMEMDPADPRAPYQLGWMMCGQGDVAGIRELLPKVEAAFYHRPESAEFAELLVRMHTIAGNTADVFKYAVAEQRLAPTEAERVRATARVERLRAQLKPAQ